MKKTALGCVIMTGAALSVSISVWSRVPDPMPIHWDASGRPDGWAPRAVGLLLLPVLGAVLSAIVGGLTFRHAEARKVASPVTLALGAFHLGMHVLVVRAALDPRAMISIAGVMILAGALYARLGLLMAKVGPNPYVGVRLPWTLSDELVWRLTHRFARVTFVVAGVGAGIASLLFDPPLSFWTGVTLLALGAVAPAAYGYALHRARTR